MTYPTAAVNTANIDASGDSPALARSDILDAITKLNQMIAHTTAFAATLLDDANAATARATLGLGSTDSPTFAGLTVPAINGGPLAGLRNAIINGNFGVNQRAVSGTVTLAAGAYGHDRFKAGASGCTYTFATSANVTTLTISAGSLQQVIEGVNLQSGTYTLSWAGTAQGKIGGGSYAASGVTGTATGGTNLTVEFNTGTLSKVQLEFGLVATAFEQRPYGMEELLCKRYYIQWTSVSGYDVAIGIGQAYSGLTVKVLIPIPVAMRSTPVFSYAGWIVMNDGSWGAGVASIGTCRLSAGNCLSVQMTAVAAGFTTGRAVDVFLDVTSGNRFSASAEL